MADEEPPAARKLARQIETCAYRIEDHAARKRFLATHAEAKALFEAAWDARRRSWAIYRQALDQQARDNREMAIALNGMVLSPAELDLI